MTVSFALEVTSLLRNCQGRFILEGLVLLEAHGHPLVQLQIFLHTVGRAGVLGVQHPSCREVVDAAVEAEFAQFIVGHEEIPELFDLLRLLDALLRRLLIRGVNRGCCKRNKLTFSVFSIEIDCNQQDNQGTFAPPPQETMTAKTAQLNM